jgi:epoxyqueuosine reductase
MLSAGLVKEKALELGFDLAGIAAADDPALSTARARYDDWLGKGHGASMEYLARHAPLKGEPGRMLEGCRSIVCVGLLYGEARGLDDATRALVSIYARGRDYHVVLRERLAELSRWLESSGVRARAFVDSEPVFERFWAWRAGLGWLGKNSVLIHRKAGSFVFLGGLFTDAALEPDAPGTDHCGRCRKCIDACPTAAITEDRTIDSHKCLAYHTIENRGLVPPEIMQATGRWIAGCDICQDVCPWNDPLTKGQAFGASTPLFEADLRELARWDEPAFREATRSSALARMKYTMFVRNVAIAVAGSGLTREEKKAALERLSGSARTLAASAGRDGALAAVAWAESVA